MELGEQKSVIADLREVVATQESEKKESGDVGKKPFVHCRSCVASMIG